MEECVSLYKIGTHADRIPVSWSLRSAGGFDMQVRSYRFYTLQGYNSSISGGKTQLLTMNM